MNHDDDCPGCGSSLADREKRAEQSKREYGEALSTALINCPHCHSLKCCMCDMGDDTNCISCEES